MSHTCTSFCPYPIKCLQALITTICWADYLVYSFLQWWSLSHDDLFPPLPRRQTLLLYPWTHLCFLLYTVPESSSTMLVWHWPIVATTYLFHVLISYGKIRTPVFISTRRWNWDIWRYPGNRYLKQYHAERRSGNYCSQIIWVTDCLSTDPLG